MPPHCKTNLARISFYRELRKNKIDDMDRESILLIVREECLNTHNIVFKTQWLRRFDDAFVSNP